MAQAAISSDAFNSVRRTAAQGDPRSPGFMKGIYASARKPRRNSSGSPSGRSRSTSSCAVFHTGIASASSFLPLVVNLRIRLRRSEGSAVIWTNPRRSSGFSAAVRVVRSIASSDATGPIAGGSGRFNDINSENCPLVSPCGRNAWSGSSPWRTTFRKKFRRFVDSGLSVRLDIRSSSGCRTAPPGRNPQGEFATARHTGWRSPCRSFVI